MKTESGYREDLNRQRLIAEPCRDNRGGARSRGSVDGKWLGGLKKHGLTDVLAHAPQCSASSYECSQRELPTRGSMLDVAVRKTKGQDRRRRNLRSLHRRRRRLVLRSLDRLYVRGGYRASGDPRHAPKLALASHFLADRRKDPTGEVVLEVTVRVADQEGLCGNAAPPLVSTERVPPCPSLETIKCMMSISWSVSTAVALRLRPD